MTDPPCQQHSETSHEAAELIAPTADTLRRAVYDHIRVQGWSGATDEECQDALQMPGSTQRPRRVELWRTGWIVDSGRQRKTRSGRNAVVWVCALWRASP